MITIGEWTDALRSGHYKQGKRLLRSKDDEFCCLGVLENEIDPTVWQSKYSYALGVPLKGGAISVPSNKTATALQTLALFWDVLAKMNDGGNSFDEIADYIESFLSRDTVIL